MSKGKQNRIPILANVETGQYMTFLDMASAKKYQESLVNVGNTTQLGYLIGEAMVLKEIPSNVRLKLVPVTGNSVEPGPNVETPPADPEHDPDFEIAEQPALTEPETDADPPQTQGVDKSWGAD